MNQFSKYLCQRLFRSKGIVQTHTRSHAPDRMLYLDH